MAADLSNMAATRLGLQLSLPDWGLKLWCTIFSYVNYTNAKMFHESLHATKFINISKKRFSQIKSELTLFQGS